MFECLACVCVVWNSRRNIIGGHWEFLDRIVYPSRKFISAQEYLSSGRILFRIHEKVWSSELKKFQAQLYS